MCHRLALLPMHPAPPPGIHTLSAAASRRTSLNLNSLVWLTLFMTTQGFAAVASTLSLELHPPNPVTHPFTLTSSPHPDSVITLESSVDLLHWNLLATVHNQAIAYPDLLSDNTAHARYFRAQARPRTPEDDWKNQAWFPEDPFRSPLSSDGLRWVKFAIVLSDPERVVFQNTTKDPFHYEFATRRLDPFLGLDRPGFDAVSLRKANQQVVLGAVLYPPRPTFVEYGVQFVGLDPYTPEEIAGWLRLVQASLHSTPPARPIYMPTFEQTAVVRAQAPAYTARGITVDSIGRWIPGNHVYAEGWALGRLRYIPAAEIPAAFADGRLHPLDILLTDGVPAETPLVAGILSLAPSSPNSHTAILARSFGVPFAHLPQPADQQRLVSLDGQRVVVRATVEFNLGQVKVIHVEPTLTPELEAELLALKRPRPLDLAPKQSFGSLGAPVDHLVPDDIRFFGGKAAHFGLLRRTLPTNSPSPAIALSFDLWDAFLDQPLPGNSRSLRQEITARLAPFTLFPPDIPALQPTLAGIRDLITGTADFTAAQRQSVIQLLGPFQPLRKIRFRSSTNVEDAESFTGAGLYSSYSGCLQDDLDADTSGPSACDPEERNERGVFRALRRVYASFYNDQAFLERLRHGVNEATVGMAVLVHHSFPDDEELANGVATLEYRDLGFTSFSGPMATQLGSEPVANPDGTSIPEIVDYFRSGNIVGLDLRQYSSRVPLGALVMNWQEDYRAFGSLFLQVAQGYHTLMPGKNRFTLDFEYKKDVNLGLMVKQVRELPTPESPEPITPYLLDEPADWVVAQREAGDVFGNHRLKSVWALRTVNQQMTPDLLAKGIYTSGTVHYHRDGQILSLPSPPSAWPGATNHPSGTTLSWTTETGPAMRHWTLTTVLVTNLPASTPPVFTQNDFEVWVTVNYATPQATLNERGEITTTLSEIAFLEPRRFPGTNDLLQIREVNGPRGVTVTTRFYWPNEAPAAGGYTAPLVAFLDTRITGLTTEPILLTGHYSQTHRPGHHNFTETFVFEPRLDPHLSPTTLAELEAADIRLIHLELGFVEPRFHVLGRNGQLRRL